MHRCSSCLCTHDPSTGPVSVRCVGADGHHNFSPIPSVSLHEAAPRLTPVRQCSPTKYQNEGLLFCRNTTPHISGAQAQASFSHDVEDPQHVSDTDVEANIEPDRPPSAIDSLSNRSVSRPRSPSIVPLPPAKRRNIETDTDSMPSDLYDICSAPSGQTMQVVWSSVPTKWQVVQMHCN